MEITLSALRSLLFGTIDQGFRNCSTKRSLVPRRSLGADYRPALSQSMQRTPLAFELDQMCKKRPRRDAVAIQGRVVVDLGYQLLHGRRTERAQGAQDLVLALEPVNDQTVDDLGQLVH